MAEKEVSADLKLYFYDAEKNKDGLKRERVELLGKNQMVSLNWPEPVGRYHILFERESQPLEPIYYWLLNHLKYDLGFLDIVKITDVFSASEGSAFFGVAQQKLGAQQDKVASFLRIIHDIFKGLVLLVRDMRIIDEKLEYFYDSEKSGSVGDAAENNLKAQFVDMVEGGAKSPMSVLGLSSQAQFTILPDLFFNTRRNIGESEEDFYKRVRGLSVSRQYSQTLVTVLERKLMSYYKWHKKLFEELKSRRNFTLKYISQQYKTVLMYMNWVKPYLKNVQRLQGSGAMLDGPELIAGFDSSLIEIEIIAKTKVAETGGAYACVMLTFEYRTKPSLSYQQEPYNRGPSHTGEVSITFRSYGWSDDDIQEYKKFRESESMELLYNSSFGIKEAMDSIGVELDSYLKQAEEMIKNEKGLKDEKKGDGKKAVSDGGKPGILEPVKSVVKETKQFVSWMFGRSDPDGSAKKAEDTEQSKKDKKKAGGSAHKSMWVLYKNFKKSHRMITW